MFKWQKQILAKKRLAEMTSKQESKVINLDSDDEITSSKPDTKETDEPPNIDNFIREEEVKINDLKEFLNEVTAVSDKTKRGEKPTKKPVKDKACNACNKMFGTTSNLNRHILTHTNIDWKCNNCDYICLTKESLQRHKN